MPSNILNLRGLIVVEGFILMSSYPTPLFEEAPTMHQPIKSAINPETAEWDVEWPANKNLKEFWNNKKINELSRGITTEVS